MNTLPDMPGLEPVAPYLDKTDRRFSMAEFNTAMEVFQAEIFCPLRLLEELDPSLTAGPSIRGQHRVSLGLRLYHRVVSSARRSIRLQNIHNLTHWDAEATVQKIISE